MPRGSSPGVLLFVARQRESVPAPGSPAVSSMGCVRVGGGGGGEGGTCRPGWVPPSCLHGAKVNSWGRGPCLAKTLSGSVSAHSGPG